MVAQVSFVAPPHEGPLQLVVTLGPSSFDHIGALRHAGATAFRLNLSHLTPAEAANHVAQAKREAPGIPLILDLQGAKMRLGVFASRTVRAGETVTFAATESGWSDAVALPHPELFATVCPGETLSVDDHRLTFCVEEVTLDRLVATAQSDGELRPRKGINRARHPIELGALSARDHALVETLGAALPLQYALSFVRNGTERNWLTPFSPALPPILKVERQEAMDNLEELANLGSPLWICRGDLGAQLGLAHMARQVGRVNPRALPVPVLMAGQVLEHLTTHRTPTRSEVCHLWDLRERGYAGVVLSDETAIGAHPVETTHLARRLLDE